VDAGRRKKIRRGTGKLLKRLQAKFEMTLPPTIYAALKFAEAQGADLRAIVEEEFGAAPRWPKRWYQKEEMVQLRWKQLEQAEHDEGETG
jgi:hypothetical protein